MELLITLKKQLNLNKYLNKIFIKLTCNNDYKLHLYKFLFAYVL